MQVTWSDYKSNNNNYTSLNKNENNNNFIAFTASLHILKLKVLLN